MEDQVESTPVAGTGFSAKTTPVDLGWSNAHLDKMNAEAAALHEKASAPAVQAIVKGASPQATGEDRLKMAEAFKSSNEARPADVLGAIFDLNPKKLIIALNGGADVREHGYDGAGNSYEVVYNQRGEKRGYKSMSNGKWLTSEEIAAIPGGITSKSDMTAGQQDAFKAQGIPLKAVAEARSKNYIDTLQSASEAVPNGQLIGEKARQNNVITKRLLSSSLDPNTLAFIRGIGSIGTESAESTKSMTDKVRQYMDGKIKESSFSDAEARNLGVSFGLYLGKNGHVTNGKGETVKADDLERLANQYESARSSGKLVQSQQQNLLERAQTLLAGDINKLTDITTYINNQAQISSAQSDLEKLGGLGVAKPSLPHQLGDSFAASRLKAINDEYYGAVAEAWGDFVAEKQSKIPAGQTPDIGAWRREFARSDVIKTLNKKAREDSLQADSEFAPIAKEINARTAMPNLTESAQAPIAPPKEEARPPRPAAAVRTESPNPPPMEAPKQKSMAEIRAEREKRKGGEK